MDAIRVLHNAARHYCIQQAAKWHRVYGELAAAERQRISIRAECSEYSDEAYGVFPRYLILSEIQRDVESFVPDDFSSIAELRAMLLAVAETTPIRGGKLTNAIALSAIADERQQFLDFLRTADPSELASLPDLPFRRVLDDAEHAGLHARFTTRWGRWYGGCVSPSDATRGAVTLHVAVMDEAGAYDRLRQVLVDHGFNRLFELREWGDGYDLDTLNASFTYNGAEGFWTSDQTAWMVYASHESSITFGGDWLVNVMRTGLRDFDRFLYRGFDLAAYGI